MIKTIGAVYSNGVLRPLQPLDGLTENDHVTITVNKIDLEHPLDGWVGDVSDQDAALMRAAVEQEFEGIEPDDWK